MASTPFNLFSQHRDPAAVLEALKKLLPDCTVVPDAAGTGWSSASGKWKRGWLKGDLHLGVNHDPAYYSGDAWVAQRSGMMRFFRRYPDAANRPDLFKYIPGLQFAVNFVLDPPPVKDDPREAIVFEVARLMQGVIFLQNCLLDAEGRAIVSADGGSDPEAKLPAHEPMEGIDSEAADDAPDKPFEPPPQERVIERLIFMSALVNRGFMESDKGSDVTRRDIVTDLKESGAWGAGEPDECAALETPVGQLPEEARWSLPWLSEGAMVLAWALELAELPSYDQQVDVHELYKVAEHLEASESPPSLRPRSDLEQLAFQMLAIHWRLTEFSVTPKAMDFEEYAPRAWCGAMDLSLARLVDHDLAVRGVPLSQASEEAWKIASGIMEERRRAIHWLLGHDPVYSENDTST